MPAESPDPASRGPSAGCADGYPLFLSLYNYTPGSRCDGEQTLRDLLDGLSDDRLGHTLSSSTYMSDIVRIVFADPDEQMLVFMRQRDHFLTEQELASVWFRLTNQEPYAATDLEALVARLDRISYR